MKALYDFLVLLGVCIVTLFMAELGARVILRILPQQTATQAEEPRPGLPAYANAEYDPAAYWEQFRRAKREVYHPYIVWRQQPSAADLINVDESGIRKTHGSSTQPDALQIWMLGGSTMWGMGAADVHTIPSYLARIFNNELQTNVAVRNLGEIGYVSTQELTFLLRELQTDRRPDIVVFLDGVNDAPAAALWPEIPGSHMNLYSIRNRFEHPEPDETAIWSLIKRSGLYALAQKIGAGLGQPEPVTPNWSTPADPEATIALGTRAADIWFSNIRMLRALGDSFGFEPYFYLQPSLLVGNKPLHESERLLVEQENQNEAKRAGMAVYAEMRNAVRARLTERPADDVFDRTDLFSQTHEPLYIDYVHMTDRGNELLAREIVATIIARQCAAGSAARQDTDSRVAVRCDSVQNPATGHQP